MKLNKGDSITFAAIIGDKRVNTLMRHADLSHARKVFVKAFSMTATADGTKTADEVFSKLLAALQKEYEVVRFVCDEHDLCYANPDVTEISDGQQWCMIGQPQEETTPCST